MKLNNHGYIDVPMVVMWLFFAFICLCGIGFIADSVDDYRHSPDITALGYDVCDVKVFLKGTSFDNRDFLNSQGLRKQYEAYVDGAKTGFMEKARLKKDKEDAETIGFATGLAVGSSLSRR